MSPSQSVLEDLQPVLQCGEPEDVLYVLTGAAQESGGGEGGRGGGREGEGGRGGGREGEGGREGRRRRRREGEREREGGREGGKRVCWLLSWRCSCAIPKWKYVHVQSTFHIGGG